MAGRDDFFIPDGIELRIRTKTGRNQICVVGARRGTSKLIWILAGANAWLKDPPEVFGRQKPKYASVEAAKLDASRIFPELEDLGRFISHGFNGAPFCANEFSESFVPYSWAQQATQIVAETVALLDEERDPKKYSRFNRPNQVQFRALVFDRYGGKCSLCRISADVLLDAAHIISWQHRGADVPENGLVLCKLHHKALDAGLIGIEPGTLRLICRLPGRSLADLHVEVNDLSDLRARPDSRALRWLWDGHSNLASEVLRLLKDAQ